MAEGIFDDPIAIAPRTVGHLKQAAGTRANGALENRVRVRQVQADRFRILLECQTRGLKSNT
jgi:hypothetical protein